MADPSSRPEEAHLVRTPSDKVEEEIPQQSVNFRKEKPSMAETIVTTPQPGFYSNTHSDYRYDELKTAPYFLSQQVLGTQVNQVSATVERLALAGIQATNAGVFEGVTATERNGAANSLATEKIGAAINLAVEKTAAATILDIEKTSSAAMLFAAQNHAAALAKAAECCCEIKELIRADGEKTRDLISSIQASNLAVQLADAKAEILALKLSGVPLPVRTL